jgi:hypothetical protein
MKSKNQPEPTSSITRTMCLLLFSISYPIVLIIIFRGWRHEIQKKETCCAIRLMPIAPYGLRFIEFDLNIERGYKSKSIEPGSISFLKSCRSANDAEWGVAA